MTEVRLSSAAGRWVVAATVLGSGMAMLDATVVNIALPAIEDELDAGLGGLQWTLDGYLLTLASLILLGGSLADRFGRRRGFVVGAAKRGTARAGARVLLRRRRAPAAPHALAGRIRA